MCLDLHRYRLSYMLGMGDIGVNHSQKNPF
jgi:hypothetical protein